jgi:hypothetical protein
MSSPELGSAVEAGAAVTVAVAVEVVAVWVDGVAGGLVVRVPENEPPRELGSELGSEPERLPAPPQPPSASPTTRAGAAMAHHQLDLCGRERIAQVQLRASGAASPPQDDAPRTRSGFHRVWCAASSLLGGGTRDIEAGLLHDPAPATNAPGPRACEGAILGLGAAPATSAVVQRRNF